MNSFLFNTLAEHHKYPKGEPIPSEVAINTLRQEILFKNNPEKKCIEIKKDNTLHTHYYIGVDWISADKAVYVAPKLNTSYKDSNGVVDSSSLKETDFLKMLFHCLKFQDIGSELEELFEVKWEQPTIEIEQRRDMLTPLLVVQFLVLLKILVRKGLKKSYYKVEHNLNSRVKGRVLVGRTIKENLFKNKNLNTVCIYDEFGLNGLENRLLKRTLSFIRNYLPVFKTLNTDTYIQNLFNYITPAFEFVSEEVHLNDIRNTKTNPLYKEYEEAIRLAKIILNRFGYNISNVEKQTIQTHPFWIDMSKLFELYVLGLLKNRFSPKNQVKYQFASYWNYLDYLINAESYKIVVDAKYKTKYIDGFINEDIRQVSGYARLKSVYNELGKNENELIDCLIIYPDQENGVDSILDLNLTDPKNKFEEYVNIYKLGIKLPVINQEK